MGGKEAWLAIRRFQAYTRCVCGQRLTSEHMMSHAMGDGQGISFWDTELVATGLAQRGDNEAAKGLWKKFLRNQFDLTNHNTSA